MPALFLCLALAGLGFPGAAAAKINLAGGLWVTYWAQQQATGIRYQEATAGGWQDAGRQVTGALHHGALPVASRKSFVMANALYGDATAARTMSGYGFLLAADCPLDDRVRVYGRWCARTGTLDLTARHLWGSVVLSPAATLRAGRFPSPFGYEGADRPTEKKTECFISEYAQDARAALNTKYDVGVMLHGALREKQFEYMLFAGNGCVRTVADSASIAANAGATPDGDDAKQLAGRVQWNLTPAAFLGACGATGDFANPNTLDGVAVGRARFLATDLYGVWDIGGALRVSGEWVTTCHGSMSLESDAGVVGNPPRAQYVANRATEGILKAVYHALPDWELGARYTVLDPRNFEAEVAAGYSCQRKYTLAAAYRLAAGALLHAEYSRLTTAYHHLDSYDPAVLAGSYRINPAEEPDDDIVALELGLQF